RSSVSRPMTMPPRVLRSSERAGEDDLPSAIPQAAAQLRGGAVAVVSELSVRVLQAHPEVRSEVIDRGGAAVGDRRFGVSRLHDDVPHVGAYHQPPESPPVDVRAEVARDLRQAPPTREGAR